ncbi:hypothetical protein AB0G32_01775 [Streptomyces sp. NPDC023723]|uniref:hypothetical protein n=1 Tax=Streptomyces sp. NPDC023723 TaxID=3154323 RepID=UPI0033E1B825
MSDSPSSSPFAHRPPGTDAPPTCEVPHFAPVRVRGGRHQLRRLLRHRRRAVAAGLAVTAAALVAAGPHPGADADRDDRRARGHPVSGRAPQRAVPRLVSAPVRIADAATVRLLRPGDRVDVVAGGTAGGATVVARGARVTEVPQSVPAALDSDGTDGGGGAGGALVVLSVPRDTAARLVGAGAGSRLAVTLC